MGEDQPQKSAAELGLLSPPSSPPLPFHGDFPWTLAQSECDERCSPPEEREGVEAPKGGLSEEGGGQRSNGRRVNEGEQSRVCVRGHWRPAEDAKLKELVCKYGPQNWNSIAEKFEGRSGKSCRLRWFNQLDPRINRRAFSVEEEEKLLAFHRIYGNKWALIARLFPRRTDNAVKNQWHVIMARKQREQCSGYRKRKAASTITLAPLIQPLPQMREMSSGNNAWSGESSITSTRDESASSCTGLPLNSSTSWAMTCFLKDFGLAQHQQPCQFFLGSDEKLAPRRIRCYDRSGESGIGFNGNAPVVEFAMTADQVACSDATSEGSATESAANHSNHAETDGDRKKTSIPFIDFLGVGATT